MKNNEKLDNLSNEFKAKLKNCKNDEEVKSVLKEAGIEPIDDDMLDLISGGYIQYDFEEGTISELPSYKDQLRP